VGRPSGERPASQVDDTSTWWATFFSDIYRVSDLDAQDPEKTRRQVDCIERALDLAPGTRILDVGCGTGRHSVALALRGHLVTGVDLNEDYLVRARQQATACGVEASFVRADMRDLGSLESGAFDVAISMYTTFGFFHREGENLTVLQEVRRVLRPGALLFLDVINRDWLLRSFGPSDFVQRHDEYVIRDYDDAQADGAVFLHEDAFQPATSMHRWTITRMVSGAPPDRVVADYRVYSLHELLALLSQTSLAPRRVLGDYGGNPFHVFSPRIIVVAEAGRG
jgi:SAM-dependent methyltransferase